MIALAVLTASALAAAPLGPCADVPLCSVRLPANALPELVEAVARLELKVADPQVGPLAKVGGDTAFILEAQWTEATREARVRISSKHRPAAVWGEGKATAPAVGEKFKTRSLANTWKSATERAFDNLEEEIALALGQGNKKLKLAIRVNGLDPAPREQSEKTLACLKSRLDLAGAVTSASVRAGYLEEALEYVPAKDEPREALDYHVAWVRAALLGGPKAPCTVIGTPLSRFTVLVSADALNRGVVVAFDRK